MKIQWTVLSGIKADDTHLMLELPNVTNDQIKKAFGKLPEGCNKKTKYSNNIILRNDKELVSESSGTSGFGIYTLYCNYGTWRIGAFSNQQYAYDLANFIKTFEK